MQYNKNLPHNKPILNLFFEIFCTALKMRILLSIFLLFGIVFIPATSRAQTPPDTTAIKKITLDEVVVQNERFDIPFALSNRDIAIIDAKTIQNLPVYSVPELLAFVAGVDIRQRGPWGGQADISINGGSFDQTLILLNGTKIIDPQTGHLMMNLPVSPAAIERIEVIKGAAASAYGINAINGAINIITKMPDDNYFSVGTIAGSSFARDSSNNKLYGAAKINIAAGFGSKKVRHFAAFSTNQSSGYRYNTAMNNNKLFYQNRIELPESNHLSFTGGFISNEFGSNGFYSPPGDIESKETVRTGLLSGTGKFQMTDNWNLRPELSYRYNNDHYIFVRQNPAIYENIHHSHVINANLDNTISTKIGIIGIGAEFRSEILRSNSLGHNHRENIGLFIEYGQTFTDNFIFNTGTYINYSKYFGWHVLPSVDLGLKITNGWHLFTNVGTGARVPTYTDWYYNGPDNIGNSALIPEQAFYTESGVKFAGNQLNASGSFFYQYTRNFIDWVKNDMNAPWQPQNYQNVKTPGINFDANYFFTPPSFNNHFSVIAGLSYTHLAPKLLAPEGQSFSYSHYALENLSDQFIFHINLNYKKHLTITPTLRYEERVNYKDYVLLDFKIEERISAFKIDLKMNNLLDTTYIETGSVPLPGRWFGLGLHYNI